MAGFHVIKAPSELEVHNAPTLRKAIVDWLEQGQPTNLVIDMTEVEYIDSTGVSVLVGGLKRMRARDLNLALILVNERILKVLRITNTLRLYRVFASLDEVSFD